MSKSWFYLGIISSLAILTSSCGNDGDKQAATPTPTPSVSTNPSAAPVAPSSTATTPATTKPVIPATALPGAPVAAIKPIPADTTAGLIPPTDPENWSRTVAKGRPDPFAVLALQPVVIAIANPLKQASKAAPTIVNESKLIQGIPSQINSKANPKIATSTPAMKSGADKPLAEIKTSTKLPKAAKSKRETPTVLVQSKVAIKSKGITTEQQKTAFKPQKFAMKGFEPGIQEERFVPPGSGHLKNYTIPVSAIPRSGINRSLPKITVAIAKKSEATKVTSTISEKYQSTKATASSQKIATKPEPVAAKALQAMAIEISGMIDVAGKTQVILKLPNESFSRYIEIGEKIAGGKVLVKRVEGQNSLSPTVVLEELGVEVSRKIGEKSTPSTPEAAPKP